MAPDPHQTPISEGSVGSVNEVAPPWRFGPTPANIIADGAGRGQGFSGTPEAGCALPTSSADPHDMTTAHESGGWRVPY